MRTPSEWHSRENREESRKAFQTISKMEQTTERKLSKYQQKQQRLKDEKDFGTEYVIEEPNAPKARTEDDNSHNYLNDLTQSERDRLEGKWRHSIDQWLDSIDRLTRLIEIHKKDISNFRKLIRRNEARIEELKKARK